MLLVWEMKEKERPKNRRIKIGNHESKSVRVRFPYSQLGCQVKQEHKPNHESLSESAERVEMKKVGKDPSKAL